MKGGRNLQRELDELEKQDPKVRAAKKRLDDLPDQMARYERHLAARKAVGKRKMPEGEE